ncbi:hypothetical protein Tco_1148983, partial [Tanacetum coccineum]
YEHVAVNPTRHGLDTATIGKPASLDTLMRLPMNIRLKIDLRKSVDVLMIVTSMIHIESPSHLSQCLFDVGNGRISIVTGNTVRYHSDVLEILQG